MDQMFETLDEGDKTTEANPAQVLKNTPLLILIIINVNQNS